MKSAEDWLAERGVERREIKVRLTEPSLEEVAPELAAPPSAPSTTPPPAAEVDDADEDALASEFGAPDDLDEDVVVDLSAAAAPLIPVVEPGTTGRPDLHVVPDRELTREPIPTPGQESVRSGHGKGVTAPRAEEARRLVEAAEDERQRAAAMAHHEPRQRPSLGDDAAAAMNYIRRATANTPMSEGRLRQRLLDRNHPGPAVEVAMKRAREDGLVDDLAFAGALVQEWHEKGHAGARIKQDLWQRGFDKEVILQVLSRVESPDPEAAAFAVARAKAASLGSLEPEVAFRRLVAHLARRGHGEGLARKVARQVLWTEREHERQV